MAFEASKRVFLYQNGYTKSPWRDDPKEEVDQSLKPDELAKWLASQKK